MRQLAAAELFGAAKCALTGAKKTRASAISRRHRMPPCSLMESATCLLPIMHMLKTSTLPDVEHLTLPPQLVSDMANYD
jgi:hypothetical protein